MTRRIPAVVVVAVLLGAVAGCGGGDSSSPTGPTSVETPTTTQTPTQTGTSPTGVCAVTSAQATQAPNFTIQIIPTEDPLFGVFYKCTKAFGMSLLASDDACFALKS